MPDSRERGNSLSKIGGEGNFTFYYHFKICYRATGEQCNATWQHTCTDYSSDDASAQFYVQPIRDKIHLTVCRTYRICTTLLHTKLRISYVHARVVAIQYLPTAVGVRLLNIHSDGVFGLLRGLGDSLAAIARPSVIFYVELIDHTCRSRNVISFQWDSHSRDSYRPASRAILHLWFEKTQRFLLIFEYSRKRWNFENS